MKKLMITGSCGFIFGNFIRKLIYEKQPYSIVSIDRVNSNTINSMYWNKNHTFHVADIRDQHVINTIFQFEKPDIVIHGAAETINNEDFISSNILGTQNIINACIKHNVERIIYCSADKVYGDLSSEDDIAYSEEDNINPKNLYAVTKASGELLVKVACKTEGLSYNIIRSSNNYGPRQTPNRFIPKIIKNIMDNKTIEIYDKGQYIRDWMHVSDYCDGLVTIMNMGEPNITYNISSSQEFSNIEIAQKICNVMKKGHELIKFTDVQDTSDQGFRYSTNSSKIKKLGWKPVIKINDGLTQTVQWFENNQWWFR